MSKMEKPEYTDQEFLAALLVEQAVLDKTAIIANISQTFNCSPEEAEKIYETTLAKREERLTVQAVLDAQERKRREQDPDNHNGLA